MIERNVVYLDASAMVKLIALEPGSRELTRYLRSRPLCVTSRVADVEVRRAAARGGAVDPDRLARVLAAVAWVELDAQLAAAAGRLVPAGLRTLDAIHLASAQAFEEQLESLVTYDLRLAEAATAAGISVASPGGP